MDITLQRTLSGLLPANPESEEWYRKLKIGQGVHADFKKIRNYAFHRKYFALLNIGFDNWTPVFEDAEFLEKWGEPEKNFGTFRKNIAILCGFCDPVFNIDQTYKLEARSISFARMEDEEFKDLYSKTIDVLLKNVYGSEKMDAEKLDGIVSAYLGFS